MSCWLLLPLLTSVVSIAGTWTVYGLALANGHVCPLYNWMYNHSCSPDASVRCCSIQNMPFVSTSGMNLPENSLYSAVLNAVSVLFALVCIFRHAQIVERKVDEALLSKAAMIIGFFGSIGGFIAGNCNPSVLMVLHYFGATLCFVSGCIYTILQTALTFRLHLTGKECFLAPLRALLAIFQVVFSICYLAFFVHPDTKKQHIGAICEWILATNFYIFIMSFSFEFYYITSTVLYALISRPDDEKIAILSEPRGTNMATFDK
ncbi:transmembrane protein 150A isoform X2 [Stegostoma tigrinum]|uniref:transmembrane protein 150A isoform X2 n=1 Tax=Stegostoma tigrinum TaxID=3053191 RepID=UPI00202B7FD9|nr:transmembrane protein 150A isoform X2 [Stegostoma tigrinum]